MAMNLALSIRGCRSWDELQKRWKDYDKKTKGDLFEALVKNYLLLTPEFASKFKAVWGFKEIPSSVFQKLKLPYSDKGIDLLAETKEGDYWAIQCKYREDSSDQITWREISTFMGLYLGRKQISFGLIASTTERITKVLKDHDRVGFLAYDIWQGLDEEFFKRLQARLYKKKEPLKARLPRPHQKEAIRDAVAYFKKRGNSRGKLIMPCGTGKSLTSFFIAEKLKAQRVLIAVPSLSLIRQTLKEWMRESLARNHKVEWICVCSDESAGKIDQDDAVVLTQDLGIPCLTDSKQIASWLKHKHKSRTIIFTTYQSGQALAKACRNAAFAFDLGIMDEAHKTAGAKDRLFSHLILDKNIKIARRLFMTATERRYRGESDEILSMEDPDDYGETIHKLSFKKALEYKPAILSDYKVVTIHISEEEIAELVRNKAFVSLQEKKWQKEMEAEKLAALIALRKAMKKYPIRHVVSFHGSIRRAHEFKESNDAFTRSFPSNGKLTTFHISGKTPTGTRAKEIEQFSKTQLGLITNARCLTEGVDVPNIDAVLFADPRKSLVDIVQSVGRALRPSLNKKFGYVIVPVVHKKDADPNEIFNSQSFREVLTTLRALGSQDERIIEYFRAISRGSPYRGSRSFEGVLTEKLAKKIKLKEFARSVELRCWDRLAKLSWQPFESARAFSRSLRLNNVKEWLEVTKENGRKVPSDIPSNPNAVYKSNGWKGWGDWIGTNYVSTHKRTHRPFNQARKWVRKLGIKNAEEWRKYCKGEMLSLPKIPDDIPKAPWGIYKEWKGVKDWVSKEVQRNINKKCKDFKEARKYARSLKIKSAKEWFKFTKTASEQRRFPLDIPTAPNGTYKNKGWISWGDWLGTGQISAKEKSKSFLSIIKAKQYIKKKGLKTSAEYFNKSDKLPPNIPKYPNEVYKTTGWKGWADYLGVPLVSYRSFRRARAFARSLRLKEIRQWFELVKRQSKQKHKKKRIPNDIPLAPQYHYINKGWKGFLDFLGIKKEKFVKYNDAQAFARKLRFKKPMEWRLYVRNKKTKKPSFIPGNPETVFKNKGWKSWNKFLGTTFVSHTQRPWCSFKDAKKYARQKKLKNQTEWKQHMKGRIQKIRSFQGDAKYIPVSVNLIYKKKGWAGWKDFLGN